MGIGEVYPVCWLAYLPRLTRSEFGWSSGAIAALKVFQNKRLLEFELNKRVFLSCIT